MRRESKVFWMMAERSKKERSPSRRFSARLGNAEPAQIIQKRMRLLLSGCSAIHAYNKPGLSASERSRARRPQA